MLETEALMNLRKTLNRLKPTSPYLDITRETVAFNPTAAYWLDVEVFESGLGCHPMAGEMMATATNL